MAQEELFWAFLEDGCPLEDLKKLRLESFDWSSRDSDGKTMLVVHIHSALINSSSFPDSLRALEWLIVSGASIEQKCTGGASNFWWEEKPQVPKIRVECKGLTSISYVRELQRKMREHLSDWKDQEAFLAKGIVELWEKSLAAKASHDLTIETADGMVTAHAHMMKAASPVVSAMLESPMKEGRTQCIEIKDTSNKAASLLLEIMYTCSAQEEPDRETALHALDLAHRWHAEVVVAILADLLAGMITDESFLAISEHAALKAGSITSAMSYNK
ncbi:BT4 [Symbiodinium natans]|uniref:BT4 protein n=1 Tax=Symbiodinium natans TaxID=878477 RepID=A0A812HYZ9_9DINO|nr:BT4 [Symbiodinium natans]